MTDALAWALIHFLWQGTALGLLAFVLMRMVRSPQARYAIGVATLVAMVTAVGATTAWLVDRGVTKPVPTVTSGGAVEIGMASAPGGASPDAGPGAVNAIASTGLEVPTAWVLSLWGLGVLLCSIRLIGGWSVARRLTRVHVAAVDAVVTETVKGLSQRLGLTRVVRVLASTRVDSPMVVGWISPVILVPVAALSGLPASQLAALLAHELAHVRRHDYLVNLLQSVVETLLFFHPAVWWVSRNVRDMREECCDDVVVQLCDRMTYVSALTTLAAARVAVPAVAASGGTLRARVERLLRPSAPTLPGAAWLAVLPVLLVIAAALPVAGTPEVVQPVAVPPVAVNAPVSESAPVAPVPAATPDTNALVVVTPPPPIPAMQAAIDFAIPGLSAAPLAQVPPPPAQLSSTPSPQFGPKPYRLGAGDVVMLRFSNAMTLDADMSRTYRVGVDGAIQLKFGAPLSVQGMTVLQVRDAVLGVLVPAFYQTGVLTVEAQVVEERLQTVLVQGHVIRPGEVRLKGSQMTVNRAILAAGGFASTAGQEVDVRRDGQIVLTVTRNQLENGDDPALLEGDTVVVRQGRFFFVIGEVNSPGKKLWEEGMTVARAVALAGGMTPRGMYGHINRPTRQPDGTIRYIRIPGLTSTTEVLADDELMIGRVTTITVDQLPEGVERPTGASSVAPEPPAAPQPEQFFFVIGEVVKPGKSEWEEGMTVAKAIALAGGMTTRGKFGHINRPVVQQDGKVKYHKVKNLKPDTPILPGDELVIARKWFGG